MKKNALKYVASSFIWSCIAKILNAAMKFISIPLLLNYFGKNSYGLIALAVSTNAYLQILNMGMNTGAVRHFSQWIASRNYEKINRVARTNISFYLALSVLNSLILLILAWKGASVFHLTSEESSTFCSLLYVLAGVCFINWTTFVFYQLLVASERMAFIQQILSVRNILSLVAVLLTIYFKWSIVQYFLCDSVANALVIIPYAVVSRNQNLIQSLLPAFYWKDFLIIFKYSLAIFAMSIFQFTATQSRPLILGMFCNGSPSILADYRVVEVFPLFVISIGGMLISILLPKASKAIQQKDQSSIEHMAYEGTKYTSVLVACLCFPIILNSKSLLHLYVGASYTHLSIWLALWIFTLTLYLYNSPVSSLVLATGKTRMLIFSSAVSCIISMVINASLCKIAGVGSAVIGYMVYIIIQMSFYYLYFNNKILELNSFRIFRASLGPVLIGSASLVFVKMLPVHLHSLITDVLIKSALWGIIFFTFIFIFRVMDASHILKIMVRLMRDR